MDDRSDLFEITVEPASDEDDGLGICLRTVASCMKTGGCPGVCGRGWSRGLQGGQARQRARNEHLEQHVGH